MRRPTSGLDSLAKREGFRSYTDYLKSPHWEEFKSQYVRSGLPRKCIGCTYPAYSLHHLRYAAFGRETLGDVIPLCNRCHRELHKHVAAGMSASKPHLILQKMFRWSDEETLSKFAPFFPHWRRIEKKKERALDFKAKKAAAKYPRSANDYFKLSKDFHNFRRYVKDGYTPEQLAKMYGVSSNYVRQYLVKYPEYFK